MSKIKVLNYHACLEQIEVYYKEIAAKGVVEDDTKDKTRKAVCHLQGLLKDLQERLNNNGGEGSDIETIHKDLCFRLLKSFKCKCTSPPSCDIPDCPRS